MSNLYIKTKAIFSKFGNDRRLYILFAAVVLLALAGGFFAYYNSEAQIIARLSKNNPRGSEFVQTIAQSKIKLQRSNLNMQDRIDALLAMAIAKSALGDRKGAAEDYNEILKINVAYPIAHGNLAILYIEMGKYEDAEYQYLAVIATQPQLQQSYLSLADLYQGYLKKKESLIPAVLTYAIDRNGPQPIFLERLATYYFDKGLYAQAMTEIDKLLQISPQDELGKSLKAEIEKKS